MKTVETYFILDTDLDLRLFIQDLINTGYTFHHKAVAYGYISKKHAAMYTEYNGHFGEGIIIHYPTGRAGQSHVIEYYIYREDSKA